MRKNVESYQNKVQNNIINIRQILKSLNMRPAIPISLYEKTLFQSANQVTDKWLSGKKYCRTYFVQKAFGKCYPKALTNISLAIDAMVNILDDLLDEALNEKEKVYYVLEFLRVFSSYNQGCPPKRIQKSLATYLEKLITLALAENFYQKQIARMKNRESIIESSGKLLICRGMDIDIFVEIALNHLKEKKGVATIKKASRGFRGLNILKKDILDIDHDLKNGIDTIVTLILRNKRIAFSDYIKGLLNLFLTKESIWTPATNFSAMAQKEKEEILSLAQKLQFS